MSVYDFEATLENGETYSLDKYKGQVMIIVNTATKCGLAPQFKELEELYEKYKDQGLVILGFPSNQFKQEVGSSEEAAESCRLTYGVSFPMHQLCQVNGSDTLPLFKYLKDETRGTLGSSIKWNFTKFLIDKNGEPATRYAPQTSPLKMTEDIETLLKE